MDGEVDYARQNTIIKIFGTTILAVLCGGLNSKQMGLMPETQLEFELIEPEKKKDFYWAVANIKNGDELASLMKITSDRFSLFLDKQGYLNCPPQFYSQVLLVTLCDLCEIAIKSGKADKNGTSAA